MSIAFVNLSFAIYSLGLVMDEKTIRVRKLRQLVEKDGAASFARQYGIDPTYISQLINGHRGFGEKAARTMEQKIGLQRGFLDSDSTDISSLNVTTNYCEDVIDIPASSAVGSMGFGSPAPENESLADHVRVTRNWVRATFPSVSNISNLAVLSAYGDSMLPTFNDGDTLIIDRGVTEIKIDAVYVLNLDDELYIKRLQRRPDGIMMISDNPQYQPYLITNGERKKFSVLGRVIWAWNGKKI